MIERATIDLESRSACNLKKCGTWRYSVDPSTEILCLCYRLPYWEEGRVEVMRSPHDLGSDRVLEELIEWVKDGGLVEAHNAFFERCMWTNILVLRFGFPPLGTTQLSCSAAKAAACALPRGLADAADALGLLTRKDTAGHKLMMKMSKPRKVRKAEVADWDGRPLYHYTPELMLTLVDYCKQDVLAEEALSNALPDLSDDEQHVYALDQTMNERGFQLDREAVECALRLLKHEQQTLNRELGEITNGEVTKATQRAKLQAWFAGQGLDLPDTRKDTISESLGSDEGRTPEVSRCLSILQSLGQSSTAKYEALRNWADPHDWRVRGGLLYHGATTGRWSGSGVQPHNFPRGSVKDIDACWSGLKGGAVHEGVMTTLAGALRGAIIASPRRTLYVADYSQIEARVLHWLADDQPTLNDFRQGIDLYCKMAESIYHKPCNKQDHPLERGVGKAARLGLGFQLGRPARFVEAAWTLAQVEIDEALAAKVIALYRETNPRIVSLWKDMNDAAMHAVCHPGAVYWSGGVQTFWQQSGRFLNCVLPSGRCLAYPDPEIRLKETPWGQKRPQLTHMGVNSHTKKWERLSVYGGLLVENVVQAIARDVMAHAMLELERGGTYEPILSVHDEVIAEGPVSGSVEDFVGVLTSLPAWADGLPIVAEGWKGNRYRK